MMRTYSLLFLAAALSLSVNATDKVSKGEALIEWVRSEGGFFSPKLSLQRIFQTDSDSPIGIFANEDISENDKLMVIPQSCLLTSGGSNDICDTALNIIKQRGLGDQSKYAAYVNYLFDENDKGQIPSLFSDESKELLETIIGDELPPRNEGANIFEDECEEKGNPEADDAYLLVIKNSWDGKMVPILDMFNRRNGRLSGINSNSIHEEGDITVVASRNIKKEEQVYLSYNECTDCEDARAYLLPYLMKDVGFLEDYPRRWSFPSPVYHGELKMFELDKMPDSDDLQFTWISDNVDLDERNFFRGHLKRIRDLGDFVVKGVEKLSSSHEAHIVTEYYNAFVTALERMVEDTDDDKEECNILSDGDVTCAYNSSSSYDELEKPGPELYSYHVQNHDIFVRRFKESKELESTKSQYQDIAFTYNERHRDTCLWLNEHIQACSSQRAHYHEVFVHYPARFVDEVKRIAFIGGGDNMIVNEVLKYPALELAVGLELDHTVVRTSFKHLGTQPHWDDDRLQWWYGDAAESLLMLPRDYYGTFDVVLLDLQTDVVEVVKVTDKLNIMDAALLLLKPDGVMARNEDWEFGSSNPFTKYTVDLFYMDSPFFVYQGITVGSNTVDFIRQSPKDHGVDILYPKAAINDDEPFDLWYNYKANRSLTHKLCRESGAGEVDVGKRASDGSGVMLVLEAEDAESLESSSSVQASVSKALKNAGLTEISVTTSSMDELSMYNMVFVLREGFAVARVWPAKRYCAFDLLLWSRFEKQELAEAELISAVGSKGGKSSSSYRVVTGGMFGISKEDLGEVGPRVSDLCDHSVGSVQDVPPDQSVIESVLSESMALVRDPRAQVVVACGLQSELCSSLELLTKKFGTQDEERKAVPIWTCPSLYGDTKNTEDATKRMWDCEVDTLKHLDKLAREGGQFGGLVIDQTMPREMARILHKILSRKRVRMDLLADNHVVLALVQDSSESWRRSFLDRFRTDFFVFDPAYRAEMVFKNTDSSLEVGVFSSGDSDFFSHVTEVTGRIEDKTDLVCEVRNVVNGLQNYIADFKPSVTFSNEDYNQTDSFEQWMSQQPLGEQRLVRFAASSKSEASPLTESQIKSALHTALMEIDGTNELSSDVQAVSVGDGCVVIGFLSKESVIASWDGRTGIVVNFYSYKEFGDKRPNQFSDHFGKILGLEVVGRDEWPRGVNRVVNFMGQIGSRDENPLWMSAQH